MPLIEMSPSIAGEAPTDSGMVTTDGAIEWPNVGMAPHDIRVGPPFSGMAPRDVGIAPQYSEMASEDVVKAPLDGRMAPKDVGMASLDGRMAPHDVGMAPHDDGMGLSGHEMTRLGSRVVHVKSKVISPEEAPDHFGLAICASICCLPMGIVALINASGLFSSLVNICCLPMGIVALINASGVLFWVNSKLSGAAWVKNAVL